MGPVIDKKMGATAMGLRMGSSVTGTTMSALTKTVRAMLMFSPFFSMCEMVADPQFAFHHSMSFSVVGDEGFGFCLFS